MNVKNASRTALLIHLSPLDTRFLPEGLWLIDLAQDLAGPLCTMMSADLGAEVAKIGKPNAGDETRS